MFLTVVRSDGAVQLGEAAARAGYRPGTVVQVVMTCTGSLILSIDDSPPPMDVAFTPLTGGAAQLATRNTRRSG